MTIPDHLMRFDGRGQGVTLARWLRMRFRPKRRSKPTVSLGIRIFIDETPTMLRKVAILMCLLASAGLTQSQLILVENLTTGTGHETIAEAIDNASPGDHLELSANTFGVACPE